MVGVYATLAGMKRLPTDGSYAPKRRVAVTVTIAGSGRLPDPQNLYDVLCDALKSASLIVDDAQKWLDMPLPVVRHGPATVTEIAIEDLT